MAAVTGDQHENTVVPGSRWETFVWPPWVPVRARLPLIAQIAGVIMLAALIVDPRWIEIATKPSLPLQGQPPAPVVVTAPAPTPPPADRPAHLNLDVRHSFGNAELTVAVDGKRAVQTSLEGSGKKFGMFGKRAERSFTRTLDLEPGVRVVRVRVRSAADKFDQTRVERFELSSASVASLRVIAENSGLTLLADRPQLQAPAPAPTAVVGPLVPAAGVQTPQEADVFLIEVFKTFRSVLIAIAGFIASAATGFVVQEFMRNRKSEIFSPPPAPADRPRRPTPAVPAE